VAGRGRTTTQRVEHIGRGRTRDADHGDSSKPCAARRRDDGPGEVRHAPTPGDPPIGLAEVRHRLILAADRPALDRGIEVLEAAERDRSGVAVELEQSELAARPSDVEAAGEPDDGPAGQLDGGRTGPPPIR
jgi:hypothetical protein